MRTVVRGLVLTPILALVVVAAAAAAEAQKGGLPKAEPPPRDGWYSGYRAEDGMTLAVNATAATRRDDIPFVPLVVAVANEKLKKATITVESVTLVDDTGTRFPQATYREVKQILDQRGESYLFVTGLDPCSLTVGPKYRFIEPGDYALGWEDEQPVSTGFVELRRLYYTCRLMYFVRPPGALEGRDFYLLLKVKEMDRPLMIPFRMGR